jgi:hypothetical protein
MIPGIHPYYDQFIRIAGLFDRTCNYRIKEIFLGDAENFKISCIFVTLDDLRQVIIWDCSKKTNLPGNIKNELIKHLQNSGAYAGYLFLQDAVVQSISMRGPTLEFEKGAYPYPELPGEDVICECQEITLALDSYLDQLHKTVSRIFFRAFGEGEPDKQKLIVLSCILKIFFRKILLEHGIDIDALEGSLMHDLITLGSAIPKYLDNGPEPWADQVISSVMVEEGCSVRVPEPIRIHLTDPVMVNRAIRRLLNRGKMIRKKKAEYTAGGCDLSSLFSSQVFAHVVRGLKEADKPTAIIDPLAGDGELALVILRLFDSQEKSPSDYFRKIAGAIFTADPSLSSVMLTRFGLVLQMMDGRLMHPDMLRPCPWNIMDIFCSNVRPGNTLLTREIEDEYLSVQQAKEAVCSMRPIDQCWLMELTDTRAMLITAPCRKMNLKTPEMGQYLCKRFKSYSHEAMTALYAAELAIRTLNHDSYIFLPSSWLSDMHAAQFRKMLRESRVTKIILEEPSESGRIHESWSCISAGEPLPSIMITRIADDGFTRSYPLIKEDLPETDGWNLEDPSGKEILNCLAKDTVPLSEYCLGALYRPCDMERKTGCFLSIQFRQGQLLVLSGDSPDGNADLIIKGPDKYLEGLLQSELISWYCRFVTRTRSAVHPEQLIAAIPVHQPDWFSPEERMYVKQIAESLRVRSFLTRKLQYSKAFHDRERIRKKLLLADEMLNEGVYSLYQVPVTLHEQLSFESMRTIHQFLR